MIDSFFSFFLLVFASCMIQIRCSYSGFSWVVYKKCIGRVLVWACITLLYIQYYSKRNNLEGTKYYYAMVVLKPE